MNFVAHAHLAGTEPEIIAGSVVGEYIKGSQLDHLPNTFVAGVRLHRATDVHTDQHPWVKQCITSVPAQHRRFAGIVLDIWFDHLLIKHWSVFSNQDFITFTEQTYRHITPYIHLTKDKHQVILQRMKQYNWFNAYRRPQGVQGACERLQQRLKGRADLVGIFQLVANDDNIRQGFEAFYRDQLAFCHQWREQNITPGEA
ncbi:ACP phosphodiesterase [Motilimonas pumila]|uniref:DUF479 domain-containing protein n=1 Tax=Motilimonas pumila TaxID=2303987 RepID=A0A418YH13_9GAMM|nr:ACP phosphodiesterase [Motilimonas pumila]RJG49391.1 DUF479 domain-containing protein [Motilimonas pumila]